jgi:hypothetical protein
MSNRRAMHRAFVFRIDSLKMPMALYVMIVLFLCLSLLLMFIGKLRRLRQQAMLEYGAFFDQVLGVPDHEIFLLDGQRPGSRQQNCQQGQCLSVGLFLCMVPPSS